MKYRYKTVLTETELNAMSEALEFLRDEIDGAIIEEYEKKIKPIYSHLLRVYDRIQENCI
jgi:hypothetical protein